MEIFRVSHLPVVVGKEYFGVVSDKDIYDSENLDQKGWKITSLRSSLQPHVHVGSAHLRSGQVWPLGCGVSLVPVLGP